MRATRNPPQTKKFEKPLDKSKILCYNEDVRKEKDTPQTRKGKCHEESFSPVSRFLYRLH